MIRTRVMAAALAVAMLWAVGVEARGVGGVAQDSKASVMAPVNLNTANASELEKLPGVGPAMATRILEYRQKNGSFKKTEELMNVKGIGEKSFLKLKALITVGPTRTAER